MKMLPHPFRPAAAMALLAALASASVAHAQQQARPAGAHDAYVGVTYGAALASPDRFDVCDSAGCSHAGTGAPGLFAGLRVGTVPVFGGLPVHAEAGWQKLARVTESYYAKPAGSGVFSATSSGHATYVAARLEVPVSQNFSFYGRFGLAHSKVDLAGDARAGTQLQGVGGKGNDVLFGLGMQYRLLSDWSIRADITSFGTRHDTNVVGANLGVAYHF